LAKKDKTTSYKQGQAVLRVHMCLLDFEVVQFSGKRSMFMKIALITGGNRGIGRAIALSTAAKGQDILLTYRSHQEEAEEVIALIEKRGRKAVALHLDVSDTKSFAAFRETVKETLKHTWKRDV
jgi:NAD(P)-dependent dehydrogenase (short-subunit alcohol dehydrogenase family)